jgi:hypothetical protein
MEDTIDVCSGCGKMPRPVDRVQGSFTCSRCGNHTTIPVTAEEYEKVVTELDRKFHEALLKRKSAEVAKEPLFPVKSKAKPRKKAAPKKRKK